MLRRCKFGRRAPSTCRKSNSARGVWLTRHVAQTNDRNYRGGDVFFSISVLLVVPSGDTVTDFSFVSTEPSLFTFSLSVLETVRSQPDTRHAHAQAVTAANSVILGFFMIAPFDALMFSPAAIHSECRSFASLHTGEPGIPLWGKTRAVTVSSSGCLCSTTHLGDEAPAAC